MPSLKTFVAFERRRGFTLIELLVVMAVIAVLVALLRQGQSVSSIVAARMP
jgi:prepilin-type N-terminal cleavage/methylation domain-containing protein